MSGTPPPPCSSTAAPHRRRRPSGWVTTRPSRYGCTGTSTTTRWRRRATHYSAGHGPTEAGDLNAGQPLTGRAMSVVVNTMRICLLRRLATSPTGFQPQRIRGPRSNLCLDSISETRPKSQPKPGWVRTVRRKYSGFRTSSGRYSNWSRKKNGRTRQSARSLPSGVGSAALNRPTTSSISPRCSGSWRGTPHQVWVGRSSKGSRRCSDHPMTTPTKRR